MKCPKCGGRKAKKKRCKKCNRESTEKNKRTPRGLANNRWRSMLQRINRKGWPEPNFSREEFVDWALNSPKFISLFENWVKSGFDKWEGPSLDRIDSSKPYSKENIQWISWWDNFQKRDKAKAEEIAAARGISLEELENEVFDPEEWERNEAELEEQDRKEFEESGIPIF